jgi:hypothetical protein
MNFLRFCLLVSAVVFISCAASDNRDPGRKKIGAENDSIRYVGRISDMKDSIQIFWPGTKIEFRFTGQSVKAEFKDERGENYFNVVIDGDNVRYFRVSSEKRYYQLAKDLSPGVHTVQLIKRTEWDRGSTWFYGLDVEGGSLTGPPTANKRVMEFFGDSITAGYAIDDTTGSDSPDSTNTNNYYTYASLTARHFNADLYCTVKSGIGVTISWFPLIMSEMYNRLNPADPASHWNFKKVNPQVVVINLFQNDSWLIKKPDHPSFQMRFGTKLPDDKMFVDAYSQLIKKIRAVYPDAYIICALGSMDAVKESAPWRGYILAAVKQLNDSKVLTHFFPYSGKSGHPDREQNRIMATSLVKFIDQNVEW